MRDLILFVFILGTVLFVFKRSHWGILLWTWLSLMNPHRLTYGAAYDFPFAAIVAGVTFISLFTSKQVRRMPLSPPVVMLLVFLAWVTITSLFALEPVAVWSEWDRVMKIQAMTLVSLLVMQQRERIHQFVWVVTLSLGFFGVKGGLFAIATAGSYRVFGPENSFIEDNNALALAIIMVVPLMRYLQLQAKGKWMRRALVAAMVLSCISAIASYSRGALLAIVAMGLVLWWKGKSKLVTGVAMVGMAGIILALMPAEWFERMHTINSYQQDGSAMGRINAWHFAYNLASDHLLGGGFNCFTRAWFRLYAPDPEAFHAAHSIYFQVLGEQGFIGLAIFLTLLFLSFRTAREVIRLAKNRPEFSWAGDLAAMIQVSLVGYCVGGAFLGLAYFDLPYTLLAILVVTRAVVNTERARLTSTHAKRAQAAGAADPPTAPLRHRASAAGRTP